MTIKSAVAPNATWKISGSYLTDEEVEFVKNFDPPVYHNDRECYLWAFDTKMPSGRWLENMRFNNDLTQVTAWVEPFEEVKQ